MTIVYAEEPSLEVDAFVDVLQRSGLAERRPVADRSRMATMLAGADLIMTARDSAAGGALVGVARCLTDTAYACYCSDLAVDDAYQQRGIGRELMAAVRRQLHPDCHFHLIAAPGAEGFYRAAGLVPNERTFEWPRD